MSRLSSLRQPARYLLSAGLAMLGWIVTQVVVIGYVSWLQPAVLGAGAAIVLLASTLPLPPRALPRR
jgi:hypothetical protein